VGSCATDSLASVFSDPEDYQDVLILLRTSNITPDHAKNLFRDWGHCVGMRFSVWDYFLLTGSPFFMDLSVEEVQRVRARWASSPNLSADLSVMHEEIAFEGPLYGR